MKINKEFAPLSITIETEAEQRFLIEILEKAKRYAMSSRMFMNKDAESFVQKCEYLERQIR